MLFIGLDDTDNLDSRGTGHLARVIAADLAHRYPVIGVTRHQLLLDPRVPCTRNNSSAAILLDVNGKSDLAAIADHVKALVLANYQHGSDPGLCVAQWVPAAVSSFGRRAKSELLSREEARALAEAHALALFGLGGDNGGIIGALAAVGLAVTGEDGRYVLVGRSRELSGLQPIDVLLATGIAEVRTPDGNRLSTGLVRSDKLRPARREGRPILVVERDGEHWVPCKLD